MGTNRLEILQSMVARNPADGFSRYGLAMEHVKSGDLATAIDHFMQLIEHNPNYAAAYFHGGQTLEKLGRIDEAKGLYRRGIEMTGATGDEHTQNELQAALSLLG
ncbi:MAG: tetratricopeptide repeat protein [Acidobacteriota bacterium]|nr:tetratricopeptide repeat protein [Acidobacteriota bacterium]